jgi:hypothetical protein
MPAGSNPPPGNRTPILQFELGVSARLHARQVTKITKARSQQHTDSTVAPLSQVCSEHSLVPGTRSRYHRSTTRRSGYSLDQVSRRASSLSQSHSPTTHRQDLLAGCNSSRVFVHGLFANNVVPLPKWRDACYPPDAYCLHVSVLRLDTTIMPTPVLLDA